MQRLLRERERVYVIHYFLLKNRVILGVFDALASSSMLFFRFLVAC